MSNSDIEKLSEKLVTNDDTDELARVVRSGFIEVAAGSWNTVNTALGVQINFSLTDPAVTRMLTHSGDLIEDISAVTRGVLQDTMKYGHERGWGVDDFVRGDPEAGVRGIRDIVAETYKNRSRTIARTELGIAQNDVTTARYLDHGVEEVMILDDGFPNSHRVCKWLDGQIRPLSWTLSDHPDEGPGGVFVPLQHPNCVRAYAPYFRTAGNKPTAPASTPEEIDPEAKLIEQLANNKYELAEDPDRKKGAFVSQRVKIEDDGYAIRKPEGNPDSVELMGRREAFAYTLDKKLGVGLVPPTVWRGKRENASFQSMISEAKSGFELDRDEVHTRDPEQFGKMSLLDILLGNTDRHEGNFLIDKRGKVWAIDHGLSMPSSEVGFYGLSRFPYAHARHYAGWEHERKKLPLSAEYKAKVDALSKDEDFLLAIENEGGINPKAVFEFKLRVSKLLNDWDKYFVEP